MSEMAKCIHVIIISHNIDLNLHLHWVTEAVPLHQCFTAHPSHLYQRNIFGIGPHWFWTSGLPNLHYISTHSLLDSTHTPWLNLFNPWLHIQLNLYGWISYLVSSNSSKEFQYFLQFCFFIFVDVPVSLQYYNTGKAKVLCTWTYISKLDLFLNFFASPTYDLILIYLVEMISYHIHMWWSQDTESD